MTTEIDNWKTKAPQSELVALLTTPLSKADAGERYAVWNSFADGVAFQENKDVLHLVQKMLVDMTVATDNADANRMPINKANANGKGTNITEDLFTTFIKGTIGGGGHADEAAATVNFDKFINQFIGAWFVIHRARIYPTPSGTPATEYTFDIDYKGTVTITGPDGKKIDEVVNSFPRSDTIMKCGANATCSAIMFIMSSANRGETNARHALRELQALYANPVNRPHALVGAYAILRRLKWPGKEVDGRKSMFLIKDLPKSKRTGKMSDDLVLMFPDTGAFNAGAVPGVTADVTASPANTGMNRALLSIDNQYWLANTSTTPVNHFTPNAIGTLVNQCVEWVNSAPHILKETGGLKRQYFIDPTTPDDLKKARDRTLALATRASMRNYGNQIIPFARMLGRHRGGADQDGGASSRGSDRLERQLQNYIIQLNAYRKELSSDTLKDFRDKIEQLKKAEKEIDAFAEKFERYNRHASESDVEVLDEAKMVSEAAKYEKSSRTASKKQLTIESALGTISVKIAGLKDVLPADPAAPDDEAGLFSL